MYINIFQGKNRLAAGYDLAIVIDVIRAFTVAHYCFLNKAKYIYLVSTIEEALQLKRQFPQWLLIGEESGYPIEGFDMDNSPTNDRIPMVGGCVLVQRTSNGVQATLAALSALQIIVTGFSNAWATVNYIRQSILLSTPKRVALIASDESSDCDLACAEYIASLLSTKVMPVPVENCCARIRASKAAQKFFDTQKPEFGIEQLDICCKEQVSSFVMVVNKLSTPTRIEAINF